MWGKSCWVSMTQLNLQSYVRPILFMDFHLIDCAIPRSGVFAGLPSLTLAINL